MNAVKFSAFALPKTLRKQRGASLLEGIAYLGIAAIVILGAVSLLSGAFGSAQSNRTAEEVTAIRTATRKLFMGQGYTTDSLNTSLIAAKAFPSTLTTGGEAGVVTNTWAGNVTVTGATTLFTIKYTNVPQDVCVNTLSSATGWSSVKGTTDTVLDTFPVSPEAATTACSQTGNTNTMEFVSY